MDQKQGMGHCDHGDVFACAVCMLERTSSKDVDRFRRKTKEEMIAIRPCRGRGRGSGKSEELVASFNQRVLSHTELVLLLTAASYAGDLPNSTAETVYTYYRCLVEELNLKSFRRFKSSNSYQSLRRRIASLKRTYGPPQVFLSIISKHPFQKIPERATKILNTAEAIAAEPLTDSIKALMQTQNSRKASLKTAANQTQTTRKKKKKRSWDAMRREENETGFGKGDENQQVGSENSGSRTLEEYLKSVKDYVSFSLHNRQQYLAAGFDAGAVVRTTFKTWITSLEKQGTEEEEKRRTLNMLKSLFFIALGQKKLKEAQEVLAVVMAHTRKTDADYVRLLAFGKCVDEETQRVTFADDLFVRTAKNISVTEKQLYTSIKFDCLVKFSRFSHARSIAKAFTVPRFAQDLSAWIRLVRCILTMPLLDNKRRSFEMVLTSVVNEVLRQVKGSPIIPSEPTVSGFVACLFTNIAAFYPIHLPFLADLAALLLVAVMLWEGESVAGKTLERLDEIGLDVNEDLCLRTAFDVAKSSFEAGNYHVPHVLSEALLRRKEHFNAWELGLFIGQVETMLGNLATAAEHLSIATAGAESEFGKSNTYALCLLYAGNVSSLQGHMQAAGVMYREAEHIFASTRNYVGQFKTAYLLASLQRQLMALELSTKTLEKMLPLVDLVKGRDPRFEAGLVWTSLATNYHLCGESDISQKWHNQGMEYVVNHRTAEGIEGSRTFKSCTTIGDFMEHMRTRGGGLLLVDIFVYYTYPHSGAEAFSFGNHKYAKLKHEYSYEEAKISE